MPKKTTGNLNARQKRETFLRAWREYAGLTLEEAAKQIGIDRTTLGRIEQNKLKQGYTQVILEAAATVYGCEPADLIGRATPKIRN